LAGTPDSPADPLIRQALECEATGQTAECLRLLALALQAEPASTTARGLMGQINLDGQWLDLRAAVNNELSNQDRAALLERYKARRGAIPDTASAHWKLALWCAEQGLQAESIAHLTHVTRLEPANGAAWRRLGCRLYHGRWMNEEQIATLEAEAESQARADRRWRPLLARWKSWLLDPARREEAARELAQVHDPLAVPSVVQFYGGPARWQRWAVYLLGRIDSPQSAQALAALATFGQLSETREAAISRLRSFDPQAYVGLLINWIKAPTSYEIESPARGTSEAVVQIDGPQARIERHYRAVSVSSGGGEVPIAATSRNVRSAAFGRTGQVDAERALAAIDRRIATDLREIDQANLPIQETNLRVLHALYQLTGKALGADQAAWTSWWTDQLGYHYSAPKHVSKPLVIEEVSTPYVSPPPVMVTPNQPNPGHHVCFAAGTLIHTRTGLRAIENLQLGDQVLAQDTTSGTLSFEPILTALHNPPSGVLRVELDSGEAIVATEIHRFWQAGQGWTMARELKAGDQLRVVGGTVTVQSITPAPRQRVYNLEVARRSNFFVGRQGVLVHDATLVAPVERPFDVRAGLQSSPRDFR
jgi:hypothetical protein